MFRYVLGESTRSPYLVDSDRELEFRDVSGVAAFSTEMAALLTWGGRRIPLEYDRVPRTNGDTAGHYQEYVFTAFGGSSTVLRKTGIDSFRFKDSEERDEALLLATEALLVHRFRTVAGDWDTDAVRVRANLKEWKVSDFGYYGSNDIGGEIR